ncbi:uncharacterized protein Z520_09619 [Fonsecaea multimorphosa CBS 102226]|uniref:TECPR1-like DysF domain-containing protein n=1 Tax=Fonsecaea multimorphosa CBS 102226 TaxID=1442371 RepID=A0A0D2KCX4_9EURO|nr:uncharacterized protein Z520_09619 [Fonsecaea multimorphosa CBS 102226]KIX94573.1 hypothetical protein Z520_09619 [Fonsecaea multimorphosa CBS 102226]OAL20282.1 hypothetical protein AYO22_08994 [Fonsecaea multimorphosa]
MDEYTAEAFANRDEPLPLIAGPSSDVDGSSSEADIASNKHKSKRAHLASKLNIQLPDSTASQPGRNEATPSSAGRISLQDRLFAKVLQRVVPSDDGDDDPSTSPTNVPSSAYVSRPAFSLPLMTYNFRRFNARIGIVFVFQNRLIRLFTWHTPTHTLSFLATYSFICLDPYLLVVVPLAIALFYIMIPAFTSRHPPPPTSSTNMTTDYHQAYTGPALAPAAVIKPAPETSKDFFRNMRDLQNSMADFSNAHDFLVANVTPATNFSDEQFSSQLFLYLIILTTLSFITSSLLPWRLIFLVLGWAAIVSSHPRAQAWLLKMQKQAEIQASLALNDPTLKHQKYIHGIPLPATPHAIQSAFATFSEITLSTTPETREVEIFELQHRPLASAASSGKAAEWQPHLFTPSPYDPLSPARIAGDRPRGTRFFEDVEPPEGWEWASKKWELDLEAGEWVNERLVVGVEYDVLNRDEPQNIDGPLSAQAASGPGDHDNDGVKNDNDTRLRRISTNRRESINLDFGGWVWDLPPPPGSGVNRDDDLWLAYGDYDVPKVGVQNNSREEEKARKKREKEREKRDKKEKSGAVAVRDWEEATRVDSRGRTGEWRRRRWVRLVKRKVTV